MWKKKKQPSSERQVGEWALYIRYDWTQNKPVFELDPNFIDWAEMFNDEGLGLTPEECVNRMVFGEPFIYHNKLLIYRYFNKDRKIIMCDIGYPMMDEVKTEQTTNDGVDYSNFGNASQKKPKQFDYNAFVKEVEEQYHLSEKSKPVEGEIKVNG